MKAFLLFLVFFLIGLAILLSYQYWNPQHLLLGYSKPALTTKFSLNNAPSDSLTGIIASMSGNVIWLSRTANKPVQLKAPRVIQQGEEVGTGSNGKAVIRIQNIASLLLHPDAHVSIVQLLPQNFVFQQDKGTVHYENTIQVPLSVRSFDLLTISNRGIVTVTVDQKKQLVTVTVENGNVNEGYEDMQNNSNVVTVNAGQTFVFDDTNKIGSIQ
jgi:hypothetical protein